ncbi:hypothetical protein Q8A64_15825 [Oxalobacteraceae bacterium R-40]|uniref:Uncharacterized protein n=1 Tax=Keguizhuia sedimenti TaxID=3064264 RepID=A0ABU1BS92_9BURK|nr:hypothetical protein [Oxalobacteraceae bacterium R-40]
MEIIVGIILAFSALAAAAYVHRKISVFTDSSAKAFLSRIILIAVGTAFGVVSSLYVADIPQKLIAVLTGFGVAHVPAAIILLLKAKRGERQS